MSTYYMLLLIQWLIVFKIKFTNINRCSKPLVHVESVGMEDIVEKIGLGAFEREKITPDLVCKNVSIRHALIRRIILI